MSDDVDFSRLVREGRLSLAPGATLKINGKTRRHDGSALTRPDQVTRKAARRRAGRAARKARKR